MTTTEDPFDDEPSPSQAEAELRDLVESMLDRFADEDPGEPDPEALSATAWDTPGASPP